MVMETSRASESLDTGSTLVYPLPGITIDAARLQSDLKNLETELWTVQDRYTPGITH